MPFQWLLQDFLSDVIHLSSGVCMVEKDGFVTCFVGEDNYFIHRSGDKASFRVPELLQGVPNQPSAQDLDQAPLLRQSEDDHQSAYPKAELFEAIEERRVLPDVQRHERKQLKRKVAIEPLPEGQRPTPLRPLNKILVDSIKMIAYRAETVLAELLMPYLKKEEEARVRVRQLLVSAADIIPNPDEETLPVRIHRMASPAHDKAMQTLLDTLNEGEFRHPETKAKMIYMLV